MNKLGGTNMATVDPEAIRGLVGGTSYLAAFGCGVSQILSAVKEIIYSFFFFLDYCKMP